MGLILFPKNKTQSEKMMIWQCGNHKTKYDAGTYAILRVYFDVLILV